MEIAANEGFKPNAPQLLAAAARLVEAMLNAHMPR
jgi:hypothetical protein